MYKVAYLISRIFDTPIMALEIFLIFLIKSFLIKEKIDILLLTLIILWNIIIPFFYFLYLYKKSSISDLDVSKREERVKWYFILTLFWTITLLLFFFFEKPRLLFAFQIWLVIFGILNAIITTFWKISGHAMLSTSLVLWLSLLVNKNFIFLFFIFIPLILWARFKSGHHSVNQLIAGVLLMLITTISVWHLMI